MEDDDVLWEGEIDVDGAEVDVRVKRLSADDCFAEILVKGEWSADLADHLVVRIMSKAIIELEAMT